MIIITLLCLKVPIANWLYKKMAFLAIIFMVDPTPWQSSGLRRTSAMPYMNIE